MAQSIALMAPTALGLFGASSHESFHADGGQKSTAVTERSGQKPPQRRRDLSWSDITVDQVDQDKSIRSIRSLHCRIGPYLDQGGAAGPASAPGLGLRGPPGARRATHRQGTQVNTLERYAKPRCGT
jgi:hypothetical protein